MELLYIKPSKEIIDNLEILYQSKNLYQINNSEELEDGLIASYLNFLDVINLTSIWYLFFEFIWNREYYDDFWKVLHYYLNNNTDELTTMLINTKQYFKLGDKSQKQPLKKTKIPILRPGDIALLRSDYHTLMISSYPHLYEEKEWIIQYVHCKQPQCRIDYFRLDEEGTVLKGNLLRWIATNDNIIPFAVVQNALQWIHSGINFACTIKLIRAAFTRCFGEIDENYLREISSDTNKIKTFCSEFILAVWQATINKEFPEYLLGFKVRPYACTPGNIGELPKYIPYFGVVDIIYPK